MAIRLGSNIQSLKAQRSLNEASSALSKTYQRLSSGLRINDANDDAAGLAIVAQLNSKARIFSQGARNINDGISLANIAEGALNALKGVSQRQLELAQEAANGTFSTAQRQSLNTESNKLTDEFNRIVQSTNFNGINLFDSNAGPITIQAGESTLQLSNLGGLGIPGTISGDGTFQTVTTYQAGSGTQPSSVAVGDLNGDGHNDIVTADYYNHKISILISNGDGSFQAAQTIATSSHYPTDIKIGDLNNDGHLDIVTSNWLGGVSVFFNNGNGTFAAAISGNTGTEPMSVALGDLNGDGLLDIVTANRLGYGDSVLINNGNGTFASAFTYATGIRPHSAVLGDVNGDGKLDIITADYTSNDFSVLIGNGDGTFQTSVTFFAGLHPDLVRVGDFNGDGKLDVLTAGNTATLQLFLGNNDGTFKAATSVAAGIAVGQSAIVVGDINGDGHSDLVLGSAGGYTSAYVLLSNGDGTFKAPQSYQAGGMYPNGVALGDINGDGVPDIVTATLGGSNVGVLLGNLSGGNAGGTIPYLGIDTQQGAISALDTVNSTLNAIETRLGEIGATVSRFNVALSNLQTSSENFEAAASRIQDVDVASESANLVREQILQQAATSVLAQANQEPRIALTLL